MFSGTGSFVHRMGYAWLCGIFTLLACGCGGDESPPVASDSSSTATSAESTQSATSEDAATPTEADSSATTPETTTGSDELTPLEIEKDELKFGFIKLTDCAPIVVAKEKGFFEEEGLQVEVIAQPNWKQLLDNVINGELDGAHMLSGQPIAATIGFGTKAHIITAYTLDLNGNGITVSNAIWEQMVENDSSLDSPTPRHTPAYLRMP